MELAPYIARHVAARDQLTAARAALAAAELEHQASYDELIAALASDPVTTDDRVAAAIAATTTEED